MTIKEDEYLNTVKRLEPDITMVDTGAALASIAISLKRIADALEAPNLATLGDAVREAIRVGIVQGNRQSPKW